MKNQSQKEHWEKFEETNPRATLLEGHLYFREEDIKSFLFITRQATIQEAVEVLEGMKGEEHTPPDNLGISHRIDWRVHQNQALTTAIEKLNQIKARE